VKKWRRFIFVSIVIIINARLLFSEVPEDKDFFLKATLRFSPIGVLTPFPLQTTEPTPGLCGVQKTGDSASSPPRNIWRALAENTIFLGVSAANYWRKYASFIEDWQYELNWQDQKKRFFSLEAHRFDSNHFRLNWTHGLAGSIYYNFGRANHWTVGQSATLTIATSLAWEYIAEWREIMAINDNIFTGLGGVISGEVIFQSAQYLLGQSSWLARAIPWLFNPIAAGNRRLDARRRYRFPTPGKERWFFHLGGNRTLNDSQVPVGSFWHLGMDQRLSYFQEALAQREAVVRLPQVSFTRFAFQFRFSGNRVEDAEFLMKSGFAGRLKRSGRPDGQGQADKSFSWLGWGGALRFYQRRAVAPYDSEHDVFRDDWDGQVGLPTRFIDKWAILNPIGLQFLSRRLTPRRTFSTQIAAYPNFSLINAAALNAYTRLHPIREAKTTLKNYGYYYGWGFSGEWEWTLTSRFWEAEQEMSFHYCCSIEGLDRFEPVGDDFPIWDVRLLGRWSLLFHPPRLPLAIGIQYDVVSRWGGIRSLRQRGGESRISSLLRFFL